MTPPAVSLTMSPAVALWLSALTVLALTAIVAAIYLGFQIGAMRDQLDQAVDDADAAARDVQQVIEHLDDTAPPPTGRHARTRDQ